jgi:hypothetical protein
MRIAFCIIVLRAQDRAQSRNTYVPSTQSSRPETKHSSAFATAAVNKNESKSKSFICSANASQKSVLLAYVYDMSVEIGPVRRTVVVLNSLPAASSHRISFSRLMLEQFVAHVRPKFFCNVEERIQGYLLSPLVCCISKRSVRSRIIKVGNTRGHGISG